MFESTSHAALQEAAAGPSSGILASYRLSGEPSNDEATSSRSARKPAPKRVAPDHAEFKALYNNHFRLVWCALTRFGVRDADLMDLTQKVFLIAYLKLPEFEGRSLVSTWLWGICRRVALAHRRSGSMRYEVATDPVEFEFAVEQRSTAQVEPNTSRQLAVEHMLSKLSESQRVVFRLSEVDDLDGPQIATLLNISLGTVRSRLRYARQRIRREAKRLTVANAFEQRSGK
jgi:RNA polymerase sigma-70 factor (ECF subfamily)